jgi:hypothetical protein
MASPTTERDQLRALQAASGHHDGRPNLRKDLQEDGEAVSEKRVARPCRRTGSEGRFADDSRARRVSFVPSCCAVPMGDRVA